MTLTASEIREYMQGIRCFLLDMDGTFYLGDRLLEGSLDFLDKLKKTDREALFLTNNSSRAGSQYVDKLKRMGVRDPFLRVLTSGQAAGRYALRAHAGQRAYVLGNAHYRKELQEMGLPMDEQHPDYVLIAFDTELDYQKLCRVCELVRRGLPYLATHPDFNCPTEDGFIPDIGATIAYIKASTGREPDLIIGKPFQGIVEEALRLTGQPAAALAMVGDRLYTDVQTAVNSGMCGILVLSGETDLDMLKRSSTKPDLVFERLSDMIPYL